MNTRKHLNILSSFTTTKTLEYTKIMEMSEKRVILLNMLSEITHKPIMSKRKSEGQLGAITAFLN